MSARQLLSDAGHVAAGLTVVFVEAVRDIVRQSPVTKKLASGNVSGALRAAGQGTADALAGMSGTVRDAIPQSGFLRKADDALAQRVDQFLVGARVVADQLQEQPKATKEDKEAHTPQPSIEPIQGLNKHAHEAQGSQTTKADMDSLRPHTEHLDKVLARGAIEPVMPLPQPPISSLPERVKSSLDTSTSGRDPPSGGLHNNRGGQMGGLDPAVQRKAGAQAKAKEREEAERVVRMARERKVPAGPVARVFGFGQMAAGLVLGGVAESARRVWEGTGGTTPPSAFLSEANAERLAVGLCRMRGAALKVGQMLSIQDESVIPPPIAAALARVRQGADVMPRQQLERVMAEELGASWRSKVEHFEEKPMAAASIGQVHRAVLAREDAEELGFSEVAMKVQYPGVAESIDSDIDNVRRLLQLTNVIPKGLYLDHAIKIAKVELARECNYSIEAVSQQRFRDLLKDDPDFYVPKVAHHLCSKRVLTTELVPGVSIDQVASMPEALRNSVAARMLRLTLMELFDFRFMQTDPNWGNFLYDMESDRVMLIDFGAAREYPQEFVDNYLRMVLACADRDRDGVLEYSRRLGLLTGQESRVMLDAHVEAAFVVGLPFARSGDFDFRTTDLTKRVTALGAVMLRHRLSPPPDEAYSLHRKLSGAFLACIKLGATVPCRDMLLKVYEEKVGESAGQEAATAAA